MSVFSIPGGDTPAIINPGHSEMAWNDYRSYQHRYPLTHQAVKLTYKATGDLLLAFELVSSFCGGLWILVLYNFRRSLLFVSINLFSIIALVFWGHKEFYAPVVVSLTLYFIMIWHSAHPKSKVRPWHCLAVLGVSICFHKLAVFYGLPIIFLFINFKGEKTRWFCRQEILGVILVGITIILLVQLPMILALLNYYITIYQFDVPLTELLTLPKSFAEHVADKSVRKSFQLFYFGQFDHFRYFFGFMLLSCPIGLMILLCNVKKILSKEEYQPLIVAILCGFAWAFLWHPHMGWFDWDLFCTAYISVNLLAGIIVTDKNTTGRAQKVERHAGSHENIR